MRAVLAALAAVAAASAAKSSTSPLHPADRVLPSSSQQSPLQPLKWIPLPMGNVQPESWLLRELTLQNEGMAGNFRNNWEPMNNSQWFGGSSTFEDWVEITPYVIDGVTPQAILLQDPVRMADVHFWADTILAAQTTEGWLGPDGPVPGGMVYWPRWPVLLTFFQLYEFTGDMKYINASLAWTHAAAARLVQEPTGYDWTGVRLQDWLYVNQYLMDSPATPASEIPFLFNFSLQIHQIGVAIQDWDNQWWVDPAEGGFFPTEAVPGDRCNLTNHGVNQAQAVKSAAMAYRQNGGDPRSIFHSYERVRLLDTYHGVPTGVFFADEHLAGNMPSHGTETCTIVELMWSYSLIHEAIGDAFFAERAEKITYNALPGSMTKDLWARVYLSQMNEPLSVSQNPHVWISDGPDSIMFGLETNYACCTSNFPQGWPKLIQRMVHVSPLDGGIAVSILGPVSATIPGGATINVTGDYPFEDDLTFTVTGAPGAQTVIPLYVRIPSWALGATMSVNGGAPFSVADFAGQMFAIPLAGASASGYVVTLQTNPTIRVDQWFAGSVAVHRGALTYTLQLGEQFAVTHDYGWKPDGAKDYAITMPSNSTVPWNVALIIDPANPGASLSFARTGPVPDVPFASGESPLVISGKAVQVNGWGFASDGSASPPPQSPVDCSQPNACGAPIDVVLVPFGTTHLRMTEIPYVMPQ